MKIGIFGYGEIGKAMAKFYKNPLIKDLNRDDGLSGVDILHVCIPWSNNFIEIVEKEIEKWCDKNNVDFEAVYTEANKTYNKGYKKLGRIEVVRPHLKYMPGKIGGHCVLPNCKILDSHIAKIILQKNKLYKNEG